MATPTSGAAAETKLQIKRTFNAPRERVFQAWTDPEEMKRWCAPSDDFKTIAEVDLRVGGKYRIQMNHPSGSVHTAVGEYREVRKPEKIVYTWAWEDKFVEDTLVTVEFRDLGDSTEVILTHERFPNADLRNKHSEGWSGCLARLEKLFAA